MLVAIVLPQLNADKSPVIKLNNLTKTFLMGRNGTSGNQFLYVEHVSQGQRVQLVITGENARDVKELYRTLIGAYSEYFDDLEMSLFFVTPPEDIVITWEQRDKPLRYVN